VLGGDADAEDAFQVTFLALARRGASIRDRSALAAWLHEAAYRIAIKARARAIRRRAVEKRGAMLPSQIEPDNQGQAALWKELQPILHEEVARLPEEYRVPVLLGYLEEKTNEEVAALLGWPVGTVKGRLARARRLLRPRLARRGLALSVALLVSALG
jgi:RNA polymerase sigma factor (sigma-70 family)